MKRTEFIKLLSLGVLIPFIGNSKQKEIITIPNYCEGQVFNIDLTKQEIVFDNTKPLYINNSFFNVISKKNIFNNYKGYKTFFGKIIPNNSIITNSIFKNS